MHQPWIVLTSGPSVVKLLGISVKRALETKVDAEKLNNMYYGSDDV
jgi:hypothetical protein